MSQEEIKRAYIKKLKVRVRREDDKKQTKSLQSRTVIEFCHREERRPRKGQQKKHHDKSEGE